jgi:hypothetical protein
MDTEQALVDAVRKTATEADGRLTLRCSKAFELAGQFGASVGAIGRICNEEGIKIVHCQLGCFK